MRRVIRRGATANFESPVDVLNDLRLAILGDDRHEQFHLASWRRTDPWLGAADADAVGPEVEPAVLQRLDLLGGRRAEEQVARTFLARDRYHTVERRQAALGEHRIGEVGNVQTFDFVVEGRPLVLAQVVPLEVMTELL